MYLPEVFEEKDHEKLYQLIENYPFATLVSQSTNGFGANHLPFKLLREPEHHSAILVAHIARNNPLHTQIRNGTEVLVIFQGEQGYISPNWYPSKQQHHQHVPTWNYQVVHVNGAIRFLEDEGYEAVTANDGDKALESYKNRKPDFILLDVMMPNRDGFEVCKIIIWSN